MEPMIKEFYQVMGWDEKGHPTREKLEKLGLLPISNVAQPAA